MSKLSNQKKRVACLYERAEKHWADGELRLAFRLFLAAARAGFVPALGLVAQFYDFGYGIKVNEDAALYWYRRAARHGNFSAANNIGCIWRDRRKFGRAIMWFQRAIRLGDGDANLQIAKIFLSNQRDRNKAIHYLLKTVKAAEVTEGSIEEARKLLSEIRKMKRRPSRRPAAKMDESPSRRSARRQ